ncbi:MAG: dioxygenase [Clostridiaceae bacterium]|nr:dioxygenase [Clostridiaceae bacterium]
MIPSLFIAHGAPSIVIEENEFTDFLKRLGSEIPKPKAIVVFSAHYEGQKQRIGAVSGHYEMIYDFYEFPEEMYYIQYAAKGDRNIAERIKKIFEENGIDSSLDKTRGIDHGAWTILKLIFPEIDIPVITLSLNPFLPPEEQYKIGKALSSLKKEDILIIGSGGIVHNLSEVREDTSKTEDWAVEFDDWINDKVKGWDLKQLFRYEELAPNSKRAVPRPEHLVTLFLAMGAGDEKRKATLLQRNFVLGNLSLSCMRFE